MRNTFVHLDSYARDRIEALWHAGHTHTEIAQVLGVHKSTVSREIRYRRRNDGIYSATAAEHKAGVKRSYSKYQGMKIERCPDLKTHIITELKRLRSPDEIAGRMKREKQSPRISTDAIYKWLRSVFGQGYCRYLCTKRSWKKRQRQDMHKRVMIPNMTSVHSLSEDIRNGKVSGHFEGDTFVSPKRAHTTESVAILIEKSSTLLVAQKIRGMSPSLMAGAVQDMQEQVNIKSLTLDRGIENREHEDFGIVVVFCDSHAPWQKPRIEGSIGLARRWFWPKGTDLSLVSEEELQMGIFILNSKYKKSLQYRSAFEVAMESGTLRSNYSTSCN
jgi:IS30 family transposase